MTGEKARAAFGADLSDLELFSDTTVSSETLEGCQDAFNLSADNVRSKVSAAAADITNNQNPATLEPTHPIRSYLADCLGDDFLACTWKPGDSISEFVSYVQEAHPGFDGVAYFDQYGNLIFLAEDDPDVPTHSAFMLVTRKVGDVRNIDPIEGYEVGEYLQSPRTGYFVYMTCPEVSTKTIMEFGAIGSTLENVSENPIMYIYGEENEEALETLISQLPHLYNQLIDIRFEQIPSDGAE